MKKVTLYTTSDGALHTSLDRAKKHAEARFGDAVCSLAHKLLRIDMYGSITSQIAEGGLIEEFAKLAELRADMSLELEEDQCN